MHFKNCLSYVFGRGLYLYLCTMCILGACRGQKRAFDPLRLELGMVMSNHVGARSQSQFLCKSDT